MGVQGLARFLTTNCNRAWRDSCRIRGPLVIDGNQLCHKLYCSTWSVKLDWVNGGQYPEYYQQAHRFLTALQASGIEPHVVFDGVEKTEKLTPDVIMKKMERREQTVQEELRRRPLESTSGAQLPHLAYSLLHNVLKEMNVPLYVGNGEGDETCAQIANFFNCPVLSDDSDFFLFDLTGGYIQLADLNWQENPVTANVYHRRDLFSINYFLENDAWFLIPAILGNGIVPSLARPLQHHIQRQLRQSRMEVVDLVYSYMRILQSDHIQACIEGIPDRGLRATLNENVRNVMDYYNTPIKQNPSDLLKAPLPSCPSLPQWFVEEYRQHNMPHPIVDAKVNGRQHHSSSLTSIHIRKCTYSILGINGVKEYHMNERSASEVQVTCATIPIQCPRLDLISQMLPIDRQALFLSILGCTPAHLEAVEEGDKLFLCSVIFWKQKRNIQICIVKALLACFVQCSMNAQAVRDIQANSTISGLYRRSKNWKEDREFFLEWQCVYKDTVTLNNLLQCPFQETCPSRIYDGRIAMSLASNQTDIDNAVRRLRMSMEKYTRLLDIIQTT